MRYHCKLLSPNIGIEDRPVESLQPSLYACERWADAVLARYPENGARVVVSESVRTVVKIIAREEGKQS